jgi:hypothetical protein
MNTPKKDPGILGELSEILEELSENNIGTQISWRRELIALLMVGGLFSACTKENEENQDGSALREAQNRIDMLGCELWELAEWKWELAEENKRLRTYHVLVNMRLEALWVKQPTPEELEAIMEDTSPAPKTVGNYTEL